MQEKFLQTVLKVFENQTEVEDEIYLAIAAFADTIAQLCASLADEKERYYRDFASSYRLRVCNTQLNLKVTRVQSHFVKILERFQSEFAATSRFIRSLAFVRSSYFFSTLIELSLAWFERVCARLLKALGIMRTSV